MKARKQPLKKYITGGAVPATVAPRSMAPMATPPVAPTVGRQLPSTTSPDPRNTRLATPPPTPQIMRQLPPRTWAVPAEMAQPAGGVRGQNIARNTNIAKNVANAALQGANAVLPGIGLAAPLVTGAIGLIGAGAAKRAAARLPEPSLETPKAIMDRLTAMQDKTMLDRKVDEYNRALQTGVEAIQMGGGREVGQIANLMRAQEQGIQSAVQEQQSREDRAADLVAQAGMEAQQRKEDFIAQERAGLQQEYAANIQGVLGSLGQLGSAAIQAKYANNSTAKDGMKTPGAFSHKTNPLAIVAKNGAMVGEMTGGEVILNPKQTNQVSKQSAYMRNLLKKPRFKNG